MKNHALSFIFFDVDSVKKKKEKNQRAKQKQKKKEGSPLVFFLTFARHGAYRQAHHDAADREFCGFVVALLVFFCLFFVVVVIVVDADGKRERRQHDSTDHCFSLFLSLTALFYPSSRNNYHVLNNRT